MRTVERARAIATRAHAGAVDRAGAPYIEHVTRVAANPRLAGRPTLVAAAFLHDVIEDTPVTALDLLTDGIPAEVVAIVLAVSRRPGESYGAFIERIAANPDAALVKLSDLDDNTNPERPFTATMPDGLRTRYARAKARLAG